MFKAITKDKAPPGDGHGTLTALWGKRQQKEAGGGTPAPPASDQAADAAAENTPAGAAKVGGGAQAAAAPATGGGDVAIGAAPEPSPEPVLAAAQAAAAEEAAAAEQQQQQPEAAAAGKASGKVGWGRGGPCRVAWRTKSTVCCLRERMRAVACSCCLTPSTPHCARLCRHPYASGSPQHVAIHAGQRRHW